VRIFSLNSGSRMAAMILIRQEAAGQERLFVADTMRSAEAEADARDQPPRSRARKATVRGTDRPFNDIRGPGLVAAKRALMHASIAWL